MSAIPTKVRELLDKHKLNTTDNAWELPQKKGTFILKHKTIEKLVAAEKITFELPQTVFVDAENAVVLVSGKRGDRMEWSYGEASPKNNKNAYPVAMAEKRAKDRVALKLLELHGDVYSEDESDDFQEEAQCTNGFANAVTRNEYFNLVKMLMMRAEAQEDLEELLPYIKRVAKTEPQIEEELRMIYKGRLQVIQDNEKNLQKMKEQLNEA